MSTLLVIPTVYIWTPLRFIDSALENMRLSGPSLFPDDIKINTSSAPALKNKRSFSKRIHILRLEPTICS